MIKNGGDETLRKNGNYFMLNKNMDYSEGYGINVRYLNPGITINDVEKGDGWYITKVFDSREKLTVWHQLLTEGKVLSEASVSFYLYTSENDKINFDNEEVFIGDFLKNDEIDIKTKMKLLQDSFKGKIIAPKDVLLHHISGRYMWMIIHLKMQGDNNPEISRIKLVFPKKSLITFLPDVYQEYKKSASFLERYLEIFETMYSDINHKIENISEYLDPDSTPKEFLEWLAEWISVEDTFLWNEEQLRYLLKNALRLYKIRGTRKYLEEMIKLYTGTEPYIVENHQLSRFKNDGDISENLEKLYGNSEYVFSVIINMGRKISDREYQILTRIINTSKPAYMGCRLIALEPYIYIGKHSYLGINSKLGTFSSPMLNNQEAINFIKLVNKDSQAERTE